MHAAHGRLPWRQLFGPAIEHARDGFAVSHHYRNFAAEVRAVLAADARSRAVFLAELDIGVPPLAALIRQPDLARTLEEIAQDGAETFYRGRLAKPSGRRHARGRRAGGRSAISRNASRRRQDPIAIAYRGFRVTQTPPNSTGFTMLQMLKIAERFDLAALDPVRRIHVLVEAKKRAFVDRERYGTDPRFGDVPLDRLLSDAYADECAAAIDMAHATDLTLAEPEAAVGDTTYFCVVDAEGNAVSGIQSLNSGFGSGVTAGDTGVLLNNRMAYWHLAPGHANRLAPGKRVRHTMNAPMVFKDDRLWAVEGTPGADNQVQVNLQVLTAMMDLDADPQIGARGAALDLEPAGPGRQLAARGRRPPDHRARLRRGRAGRAGTARASVEPRRSAGRRRAACRRFASPRTACAWPAPIRAATAGPGPTSQIR